MNDCLKRVSETNPVEVYSLKLLVESESERRWEI